MKDQPLSSGEQSKVIIFILLMLPAIAVVGAGVIPTLLLIFGVYMMMKSGDFSHITVAVRNCKIYLLIILSLSAILIIGSVRKDDILVATLFCISIFLVYTILLTSFFYKPLENHKDWVVANGIFATTAKVTEPSKSNINAIKVDKKSSYSVADELSKWVKLKEDGHISDEEFKQARKDLFGK